MTELLDGGIESYLRADTFVQLLFNFFAQMNFQFLQRHGRFDSSGEHLLSPFGN